MNFAGEITIAASRDAVFKALSNAPFFASCVEGVRDLTGRTDAVQQAFIDCGAFQCGYCTPGFVLMAKALLVQHPDLDDEQIRDYPSGNLCRCAAYPEIVNAVKMAARKCKAGATG